MVSTMVLTKDEDYFTSLVRGLEKRFTQFVLVNVGELHS